MKDPDLQKADARILGQILAAQNILFVLTTEKQIAEFYAKLLISLPGVTFCRVCLGNASAQEGEFSDTACAECENIRRNVNESAIFPEESTCKLAEMPGICNITIETMDYPFGFFILGIDQTGLFDLYQPFISNLGNFVALSLENRLQKNDLQKVHNELENKIEERTASLKSVSENLKKEIEERKQAEITLQEQYSTLHGIINSTNIVIFSLDRKYRYTTFNKAHAATMKAIYGMDIEIGNSLLDYMTVAEDWEKSKHNIDRALAGESIMEEAYSGEKHLSRKYFQVSHSPIKTKTGEVIGVAVLAQDITERKLTEEALRISEDRYRMAQAISHVGNWEYNLQTAQFWGSDEAKRIYGFDPEQGNFSTDEVESCIPERVRVHQALIDLIEADKEYNLEFEILPRNSSESKIIESIAELLRDEHGDPLKVAGVIQDITARKKTEEEIRKLNQELEQRVADRTLQLEATNKELEAFAYSVSHDLRAPLRSIDGFSMVLLDGYQDKIDEQGRDYLQRVRAAAQRMAQLIDDMLTLSRATRHEMVIKSVNLSVIVKDIADNLCRLQPGRQVEFIIQPGIIVKGDEHLLRIVLENLFNNAWKFTSHHNKTRIEFGTQQKQGKQVYFVRDNGAGFDMLYAQKLFNAFQRLHSTKEFPGTGIGLATVQRVIRRHGGDIWAEGEVEKGATVYFTLLQTEKADRHGNI